ncbi:MAG: thioredoxin domain-containing protein [Candidatus Pacebacteria bacterium]|nr:thioredoxin domain-containing protein [Candidatus Paceibacterota bacterium]
MTSTSKRRNKRAWIISIIAIVALLIIAFIISRTEKTVDPASFADVVTFDLGAHEKGNLDSQIRLIEYSDFQCPACKSAEPAVEDLVNTFGDQFVFEYRHYPLRSIHPNAQKAAEASEAAAKQGKFWEMHDILFARQNEWSQSFNPEKMFSSYAKEIGLNVDRFKYDLKSDEVKKVVNDSYNEAVSLNLPGTPSFVYDGKEIDFNDFINQHLDLSQFIQPEIIEE